MGGDQVNYLQILKNNDDPLHPEFPEGFDYLASKQRFLEFAHEFQTMFEVPCIVESGSLIQDASFLGQILLPVEYFGRPQASAAGLILRVSNFGNMAAIYDDSIVRPELIPRIKNLLQQYGYLYVPSHILAQPRTSNPPPGAEASWWYRYFDWL